MRSSLLRLALTTGMAAVGLALSVGAQQPRAPEIVDINKLGQKPLGETSATGWAVVIGIDQYQHLQAPLQYCSEDAAAVQRALIEHCRVPADHIRMLRNQEATAQNIRSALGTWLPKVARVQDLVFIYYSGHGCTDRLTEGDNQGVRSYLVSHDARPEDLFATGVAMDELSAALMRIRAERTVVLLDCCYSGAAQAAAAGDGSRTFQRPVVDPDGSSTEEALKQLTRSGRGRAVMTACRSNERSREDARFRHGVFTHFLLEGLSGKAPDDIAGLYGFIYSGMVPGERAAFGHRPLLRTALEGPLKLRLAGGGQAAGESTLRILTSPLGAEVFVDRNPKALRTPAEIRLRAGAHQLFITRPGYEPVVDEITVTGSEETDFKSYVLQTEYQKGDLLVLARPGDQVALEQDPPQTVPESGYLRLENLVPGPKTVAVSGAGVKAEKRTIRINPGRATVERFELEKALAGVRLAGPGDLVPGIQAMGDGFVWTRDGAAMAFVSEGPFFMGRDDDPRGIARPRREVNLPAFWVDRTEVTNGQYARFVQETGYRPKGGWNAADAGRPTQPATQVTLDDARAYARWAGKRLPTEAEWEKAARGTDGRPYPYGAEYSARLQNGADYGLRVSLDAGQLAPGASPYGALDMLGNLEEWCDSLFTRYPGNPTPLAGEGPQSYVIRGGSFRTRPEELTVTQRSYGNQNIGQPTVGFRSVVGGR